MNDTAAPQIRKVESINTRTPLLSMDSLLLRRVIASFVPKWFDRLLAAGVTVFLLAGIHTEMEKANLPAIIALGIFTGAIIARIARHYTSARLRFHETDGPLTAYMNPITRKNYTAAIHITTGGIMTVIATILDYRSAIPVLTGYISANLVRLPSKTRAPLSPPRQRRFRFRTFRNGIAQAIVILAATAALKTVSPPHILLPLFGIAAFLSLAHLSRMDHATIRFMAIAGLGCATTFRHHIHGLLGFAIIMLPAAPCLLGAAGFAITGGLLTVSSITAVLTVFLHRLYNRRTCDALLTLILLAYVLTAAFFIASGPVGIVSILLLVTALLLTALHRIARTRTWRLP